MSNDLDIGPLSWVKSEIDLALERASASLREHDSTSPDGNALATAVKQLHQAHGALTIVGLDGIIEFSDALEQLFGGLADGTLAWSEGLAQCAQSGLSALRDYLDGLMAGEANQPLRLLPAYSALITATGAPAPSPAALFFPDLSQRPPRREVEPPLLAPDKLTARLKMARMGYERGLLKVLKGSAEDQTRGISEMKNAVAMIEATQSQPGERAFWWIVLGFFAAYANQAYTAPDRALDARKLAMKVGAQIKHFSEGRGEIPDTLMSEALYLVATAKVDNEQVNIVRAAYRLDDLIPSESSTDLEALRPHIRRMRETLASAKEDWNTLCSGVAAALPPFHEKVTQLSQAAPTLALPAISRLTAAITALTDSLRRDPSRHTDAMGLEVATALLLCDSALENIAGLDQDFDHHAETMAERLDTLGTLDALGVQRDLAAIELPHLDAMARRAQERLLLASVAHEITINLGLIEQTLDAYFRDPGKQASLRDLARPVKQIEGALMILGQDRAVALLKECAGYIDALANGGLTPAKDVFEDIASKLSALGFFIEQLELGTQANIDAILPAAKVVAAPVPALVPSAPVEMPEANVEAEVATTELSESPSHAEDTAIDDLDAIDSELLEIFLDEAHEVLASIGEQLPRVHADAGNVEAMTILRRSVHTLKGSGRMVKLNELGDAAWGVEQVMNHWLQDKRPATPALLSMLDHASTLFANWVQQLAENGQPGAGQHPDASTLATECAQLLQLPQSEAEPAESETPAPAEDARSAADIVAAMEAAQEKQAAEQAEAELAAAELAAAEILAEGVAESAAETAAENLDERDSTTQSAVPQRLTFAQPDETAPPPLPQVSEAELAAAELEAAEIMAAANGTTGPAESPKAEETDEIVETAEVSDSTDVPEATSDVRPFPTPPPVVIGSVNISPTLFAIYLDEAHDHLATIQAEVTGIGVPSDALIRAAHTLASTSGTTGLVPVQQLARALEVALGALAIVDVPPTEAQRLLLARCAGALDGMLGAIRARRMPAEEAALAAELAALKPDLANASAISSTPAITTVTHAATPAANATSDNTATEFALPASALAQTAAPATLPADLRTDSPPESASTSPDTRLGLRLDDDIDLQLLPLFLEESVDLMASIDAQLRGWRGQPDNEAFARQLQRDLHTIKGSARMAGAMGCGDLFHSMESRIEQAVALRQLGSELFDALETSYDRGALLIDRLRLGQFGSNAETTAEDTSAAASHHSDTTGTDATESATPLASQDAESEPASAASAAPRTIASQSHVRVRADLIDSLVNEAGEVAIARARIEGEMRALKSSLLELTENVIRLRSQVREIEIQAETQMASQLTELKAQAERDGRDFDPLEFDRFTRFQELTRMMAESVNDVSTVQHSLLSNVTSADAALTAQARLSRELSQRLMSVRMMPFDSMAERLHRVVRQAAKDAGKRANLDIKGGQMGIDRSVLEHIGGPLEHLLRNAVAHGLEAPDQREQRGKPGLGQITIALAQEGNDVVIALSDDGAGLDLERIRAQATDRGLLAPDTASDDAQLISLIFASGFTTASEVSTLAGRGIGMDVVKTEVDALGGRIEVSSTAGKGCTFRLYLPLTLAVSQAVLLRVGNRSYALPASMVEQASEMKPDAIAQIRQAGHTEWLGRRYPYHYLPQLLGMTDSQPQPARRHWLLLIKGGTERLALEVDGMIGNREIVIKNLGPQLRRVAGLTGATVLPDGEIALILNPIALLTRQPHATVRADEASAIPPEAAATMVVATANTTIMVVDDSLTVRKVTGRLLGRNGYQVVTAKDGVDALEQLSELRPAVMLVDIEMPRMDGFELARTVRADASLRDIPIIMITSRSADKHRQYAKEIGVNHYLGKPYDENVLLALIASFVQPESPS